MVTSPYTFRVAPPPTGADIGSCHQSHCAIHRRQIAGPLIHPRLPPRGTHPGQTILQDRDPTVVALPTQPLEDHTRRHPRIPLEHHPDRTLIQIQLRPPTLPPIPGRVIQAQQPRHRVTAHPQPPSDPRLRQTLPVEQPMDPSPIMHFIHPFLPRTDQTAPGSSKTAEQPRNFRPARSAQYSPDVDTPRSEDHALPPCRCLRLRVFVGFGRSGAGAGVMLQVVLGRRSCRSW